MNETLKNIIDSYRCGLLSTPNIRVIEKKFSEETIKFPNRRLADLTFCFSTFKKSHLTKIKFINVNFELSYFENCVVENCIFENTILQEAEFDNCVFKNCRFIDCNLSDFYGTEIIFNEYAFVKNDFKNAIFKSCHFLKPVFEGVKGGGLLVAAVLIDSKFSNSKKSIEFKGDVYFIDILGQIDEFCLD